MRALLALLLLAGCSSPEVPRTAHDAPPVEEVAAQTSPRVEALRSATNAYTGAALAFERALQEGIVSEERRDVEARAYDGLQYLMTLKDADEAQFTAAQFYVNNAIDELYAVSKEQEDAPEETHSHH